MFERRHDESASPNVHSADYTTISIMRSRTPTPALASFLHVSRSQGGTSRVVDKWSRRTDVRAINRELRTAGVPGRWKALRLGEHRTTSTGAIPICETGDWDGPRDPHCVMPINVGTEADLPDVTGTAGFERNVRIAISPPAQMTFGLYSAKPDGAPSASSADTRPGLELEVLRFSHLPDRYNRSHTRIRRIRPFGG